MLLDGLVNDRKESLDHVVAGELAVAIEVRGAAAYVDEQDRRALHVHVAAGA